MFKLTDEFKQKNKKYFFKLKNRYPYYNDKQLWKMVVKRIMKKEKLVEMVDKLNNLLTEEFKSSGKVGIIWFTNYPHIIDSWFSPNYTTKDFINKTEEILKDDGKILIEDGMPIINVNREQARHLIFGKDIETLQPSTLRNDILKLTNVKSTQFNSFIINIDKYNKKVAMVTTPPTEGYVNKKGIPESRKSVKQIGLVFNVDEDFKALKKKMEKTIFAGSEKFMNVKRKESADVEK